MTARIYLLNIGGDELGRICRAGYAVKQAAGKKYAAIGEVKTIRGEQARNILAAMPWRG